MPVTQTETPETDFLSLGLQAWINRQPVMEQQHPQHPDAERWHEAVWPAVKFIRDTAYWLFTTYEDSFHKQGPNPEPQVVAEYAAEGFLMPVVRILSHTHRVSLVLAEHPESKEWAVSVEMPSPLPAMYDLFNRDSYAREPFAPVPAHLVFPAYNEGGNKFSASLSSRFHLYALLYFIHEATRPK